MTRKINIDREKPSSEEIRSRKDFKSVLNQYSAAASAGVTAKPFFKSTGFLVAAAITLLASVSAIVYFTSGIRSENGRAVLKPGEGTNQQTAFSAEQAGMVDASKPLIAPPLTNTRIPYQSYKLNASTGGEFTSENGSTIHVPENAFADASGKILQGEVDLRFREFRDPVDFFVSGIPMSYDSAGKRYQFESAGMVEVTGFKDSKPVQIAAGKKVDVQLMSVSAGHSFNLYRLDTATRNWVYVGKDVSRSKSGTTLAVTDKKKRASLSEAEARKFDSLPEIKTIDRKINGLKQQSEKQIAALPPLPAEPLMPQKANVSHQRFNIDIDPIEFPEMKQYRSAVFEVGPEASNKKFSNETYKTTWDDIQLSEGTQKGLNYYLTLKKGIETLKIIVYPVLEGKAYDAAKKKFDSQQDVYNTQKKQRDETEKKIGLDEAAQIAGLSKTRQSKEEQWKKDMNPVASAKSPNPQHDQVSSPLEKEVIHSFSLSNFGIYNCDCPIALPEGAQISIRVTDESGKDLGSSEIYLVDKKLNSLFKYYAKSYSEFRFDPSSKNMAWTVIGNKMYILKEDEFRNLHTSGQEILHMTAIQRDFKDADEIRTFLGI
jgi:hypothetical protein